MRIVRRRGDLVITETRHGFVCANSGVDLSNVERGQAALLPLDSDRSSRRIRDGLRARLGVTVGVIVSDTFGRPWRKGLTDVAIGCAGVAAVVDLRGTDDALGRTMQVTEVAVADELAAAAELVMGKSSGVPVAVVRGVDAGVAARGERRGRDRPAAAGGPVPLSARVSASRRLDGWPRGRRGATSTAPTRGGSWPGPATARTAAASASVSRPPPAAARGHREHMRCSSRSGVWTPVPTFTTRPLPRLPARTKASTASSM